MSRLIDTEFGQFRQVTDGKSSWFLLQCPDCGEMLPMTEAVLQGKEPVTHESQQYRASFCSFNGTKELGVALVAKMQTSILFDEAPFHDEGQPPSRLGLTP